MNRLINEAFLRLARRSEQVSPQVLVGTFVDAGSLFALLSSTDHQIVSGRRGTGKTHALKYLAERKRSEGHIPVYLDMRTIGSTGGIYGDPEIPTAERATRLLMDTVSGIHEALLDFVTQPGASLGAADIAQQLDELANSITEVVVVGGRVSNETTTTSSTQSEDSAGLSLEAGSSALGVNLSSVDRTVTGERRQTRATRTGTQVCRVHFGRLGAILGRICGILDNRRIWLILDEWSVVPLELQPYLADLIRRSVLPVNGITVKIGAIEQRSVFQLAGGQGEYTGIEVGADVTADLNLDDIMVFENDASRATHFFQELLYRHFQSVQTEADHLPITSSHNLVQAAFTQRNVFEELVKASEGVPRDFINILVYAAQRANTEAISVVIVRSSARLWYQRDKETALASNASAQSLLHHIIDEVIGHRRARAFLLRSGIRNELIDSLFDARVLHLLKRSISAHDQPGIRYDVYKLDYGCYVDLLSTARAPQGLLRLDSEQGADSEVYVEVPPEDYRAIRRAILNLNDLDSFQAQ